MGDGARHAKYSASNAHRFLACPGQPSLAAQVPQGPDSEYAVEGTRAHDLLASRIRNVFHGEINQNVLFSANEMWSVTRVVLNYVQALKETYPDLEVLSEHQVIFPQPIVENEECAGTADVVCFSKAARIAWVIDFKYGVGEPVIAKGNEQILFYTTAALWDTPFNKAYGVIIQPRCWTGDEIQEVEITSVEMVDFQSRIAQAIRHGETAVIVPGTGLESGEHCHNCIAAGVCPALESKALAVISPEGRPLNALDPVVLPAPADLSMERLGHILDIGSEVVSWINGVKKYAYERAMAGEDVPGHKLVESKPVRQWLDQSETSIASELLKLGSDALSLDSVMPRKLLALTNAAKVLIDDAKTAGSGLSAKKLAEDVNDKMAFLIDKKSKGNITLVPVTDPRPAVNKALQDFAGVVTIDQIAS